VKPALLDAMFRTDVEIAKLGLMTRRFAAVAKHCSKMLWRSPVQFAKLVAAFAAIFLRKVKRALPQPENQDRSSEIGGNFWSYSIHEFADSAENANYRVGLSNLAVMDEKLGPTGAYLTRPPEEGTLAMPNEDTNSNSLLRPLET